MVDRILGIDNQQKSKFARKRVLVMGLGLHGGGVGAAEFLIKNGAKVTVTDLRTRQDLASSLKMLARYRSIRYTLGGHREEDFRAADMILKNPGVRRDHPLLAAAERRGTPVVSDVEIFFRLCPGKIIGVTGTRGKSTTTWLIWKFLKTKYRRAHYGGNIRRSVLSILPQIKKEDLVVLELSSFQLMDLVYEKKSPAVAVLTNIMEDHLNWHRGMEEYKEAKQTIFRFQRPDEDLFIPNQDVEVRRLAARSPSRMHITSLPEALKKTVDERLGSHYRPSVALALTVGRHFGVADAAMRKILEAFRGLEGRQEELGAIGGVYAINDTTATIPDAAIAAITRFRRRAGKRQLILIAGGQDKRLNFSKMAAMIERFVDMLVLLPGTGTEKLKKERGIGNQKPENVVETATMEKAVKAAYQRAEKGDYIVLSPGATSFGLFLNEFDRGAQFAGAVRKLKTLKPKT